MKITKAELIGTLVTQLPSLTEARILELIYDVNQELQTDYSSFKFTGEELIRVEKSFEDFKQGRILSLEDAMTELSSRRLVSKI